MRRPSSGPGPSSPNTPICADFPPTVFNSINLKIRTSWAGLGWVWSWSWWLLLDRRAHKSMNCTISGRGQYALLLNTQLSSSYPRTSPNLNVSRRCLWNEQNLHIFCTATDILLAKGRARPSRQAPAHAICSEEASNISNCCGLVKNSGHASSGGLESFKCMNILCIGLKLSLLWWHKKHTDVIITTNQCEKISLLNTFCCKNELHRNESLAISVRNLKA